MANDTLSKINQSLTGTSLLNAGSGASAYRRRQFPSRNTNTNTASANDNDDEFDQSSYNNNRSVLNPLKTPAGLKFDHLGSNRKTTGPGTPGSSLKRALDGLNLGDTRNPFAGGKHSAASKITEADLKNPVLLCFGSQIVLRSAKIGKCLSVDPNRSGTNNNAYANGNGTESASLGYGVVAVDVDGSGTGADEEVFTIVNVHFRNDKGPVRFGDTIALCSQVRFEIDTVWGV